MTVADLRRWCNARMEASADAEVLVHRGPILGFTYLDEDEVEVESEQTPALSGRLTLEELGRWAQEHGD